MANVRIRISHTVKKTVKTKTKTTITKRRHK